MLKPAERAPVLLLAALLAGCTAPPGEDPLVAAPAEPTTSSAPSKSPERAALRDLRGPPPRPPGSVTTGRSGPEERDPTAPRPRHTGRPDLDEAANLASLLQPYDSPLPGRSQLEAGFADPLALLLGLSADPELALLARANAATALGLFPESDAAVARLVLMATDPQIPSTDRRGALDGIARLGARADGEVNRLRPLLHDPDFAVQAHAVRAIGRFPATHRDLRRLVDDPQTNADVLRLARRALAAAER